MSEVPDTGRVIADRYRLLDPLGEGGAGTVWRARDEVLGREVAVKEVRIPAALPAAEAELLHSRLEGEVRTAARVTHRNVVTVHDVVTQGSRPWIVMELVRGLTLSDVLAADGPLSPRRAARIGAEVLAALRGGHEAGVLHRDVKPGNVLLANDGRVMLKDFGITADRGTPELTLAGEPVSSPDHVAPERALGRAPGPESDLWSLGVLLYVAAEGRSPFGRNTPAGTLRAVGEEEPPPLEQAGALGPVIEGLLRKDPAERLTAGEAERRLRILAAGGTGSPAAPPSPLPADGTDATGGGGGAAADLPEPTGTTRRTGVLVAVAAVVTLLVAGGLVWALAGDDDPDDRSGGTTASTTWSASSPAQVPAVTTTTHGKGAPQDGTPSSTHG
ncbi:serine/threonine-protein kinase [Streptomyces sp. NPDC056749]|uniref:serine/threonine-protein kinase n=1 Tax=Streptomyces sp. NPDC056749 TaxID=3345936 RepID=UPI00368748E8